MNPTIHQTDLFHPHADPDDHWDLACQFALAKEGDIDLKAILIDHPPEHVDCGDPAVCSIGQLAAMTGVSIPFGVGVATPYPEDPVLSAKNAGIRMLMKLLEDSPEPVTIHVVGSCRDVSLAGMLNPGLFKEKCKAIYLNAGSAFSDPDNLEYKKIPLAQADEGVYDDNGNLYFTGYIIHSVCNITNYY